MAERLAHGGFIAVAPNLFRGKAKDPAAVAAGDERVYLPDDDVGDTVDACIDTVRERFPGAASNTSVIGVCQSGRYPIVVTSRRSDLAGCAVIYGAAQEREWAVTNLQPRAMDAMLAQIDAATFFLFAEGDHTISLEHVARVREALEDARLSYTMRVYPDVPHGFMNYRMPGRYRQQATEAAWRELLAFLATADEAKVTAQDTVTWDFSSEISPTYDFVANVRVE